MIKTKLSVAIAALGTLAATGAMAQSTAPGPGVEEVVVTGSRIARDPLSTSGPITIVDSEAIQRSGVGTIDELLNQLPSMGTTGINANDNNGGGGVSFVDLRNLGSERTLVLVNGRRFVSSSSGTSSAVDMNNIPVDMIDRVEVLTDGASAIYGSDAVAGVINVVLKKSVEGVQISAKAGTTSEGGGDSGDLSITFGNEGARGSFIGNISHTKRDEITYNDRDWASLYSSMSPTGNIFTDYGSFSVGNDGKTLTDGYTPYDIGQYMWLSGAMERSSATFNGTFSVSDSVELYGEASYTTKTTNQQLAAQPMYGSNGLNLTPAHMPAAVQQQLQQAWQEADDAYQIELAGYQAAHDAWVAQGSPKDLEPEMPEANYGDSWDSGSFDVRLRPVAAGTRDSEQQTDTYRAIFGARGDLANGWGWDTFASYGRNEGDNSTSNSYNKDKLQQVLDGTSPIANPQFLGGISKEVTDYISYTDKEDNQYTLKNFGANLTGDIEAIQFQGGALGFATGIEYREESGEFNPSAETQSGATFGNQQDATEGKYSVTEAYAEFNMPILSGVKYAEELSADLAVRYSDFDTFGGQSTGKLGLVYAPTEDVRFRASASTSFRAPGIYELYSGSAQSYEYLIDPCDTGTTNSDGVGKNCVAGIVQSGNQVPTNIGGNSELEPEEAKTLTAGVVYTPSFAEDLSITLDYFDIQVKDAITSPDLQRILDDCYREGMATACERVVRDNGGAGQITALEGALMNIGEINTRGVDIDVVQNFHYDAGELALRAQATRLLEYEEYNSQTGQTTDRMDYIGTTNEAYVKWRGLASATWYGDNWNLGADVQYLGDGHSPYMAMPSHTYLNLKAGWDVSDAVRLSAGVDNVTDREPATTSGSDWNSAYDFQGRYAWAGVNYQF
ncbi:TonB-dependent receptor plug domain-containing protein [Microbulbifer hainanensis]|uniref:TonB-dependent receptor plug domain-containing protein n=1 Tax=Microbulbifer hainanensis TaxID=2735675 RepID=UPI00186668FE|nr:TonB-dependent receptor [Microbulbifer hainanensis]